MGFTSEATVPAPAAPPPPGLPDPVDPPPAAPASDNGATEPASPQGEQGEDKGLPQPEPTTEATPTETPPEHPWAGAADVDAVLAVESVAERVKTMAEEGITNATEEGRRTAQSQLQPILQANQQRLEGIDKHLGDHARAWNKLVKSGGITQEEATDIIEANPGYFDALRGVQLENGRWEGRGEWIRLAGEIDASIPTEFTPRFQALQSGLDDPTFTTDFLKAVGKAVADPIRAELKEAKANIERLESQARTAGRTETKPPATLGGRGGASAAAIGPDAIIQSPTSTVEEKKAAFKEKHGVDIATVVPMN